MLLAFFKVCRLPNLLIIIITQYLIKYSLFNSFGIDITLSDFGFFLLCLATVCIAAAGNIINDIYDIETDQINKPQKQILDKDISLKTANNLYIILSVLGVGIGFYLSNLIGKPGFSAIFILISALLYLYATYLKQVALLGNVVISSLVAMVILIVGLFDLFPAITPGNRQTQSVIFSILLDYALFAFLLNILREIIKDQEDIIGDYNSGRKTLPIILGAQRTNKLIFLIGLIPLAAVIFYIYQYLYQHLYAVIYALLLIVAPLLYFLIQLWTVKTTSEYRKLSLILKLIMVSGLLSIGLYQFIL
ncbi:geranylgeranylglycerol-phosphate geranylgeranyltransferase [Gillisia sp. M10.2A]|uniref:Geranylgeranylglycerol-phosphate geranylgeranyltransferase n=1 Tax=Gillisia lutea TaxID=2909668 RepID=A0ABS9EJ40_9FLAO|nr:geranylgeranylglycerol-phosphate geranylgeranyltransferase [Gillisia lutea]MCF4101461.1 geranylgeranylglycerol-phosphate geranylgeranyltransferase [Gillisia lutea]